MNYPDLSLTGRKPGIYNKEAELKEQVDDFEGSIFQKFEDRERAEEFFEQHRDKEILSELCDKNQNENISYSKH